MSADVVQGNYEQLQQVATRFQRQSEQIAQMEAQLRRSMQKVEGTWEGRGSDAFHREMNSLMMPGVVRLKNALNQANTITAKIANTLKQAEEEASALFKGNGSGGGGTGDGGMGGGGVENGSGGGTPGSGGGGTGGGSGDGTPAPMDTTAIFNEQYMTEMTNTVVPGSNSPVLNDAMEKLLNNPSASERDQLLETIAKERGVPVDQMKAQYEKFLQLRDSRPSPVADIDTGKNPDFLGSTTSLRYGKVVGDALGLDPVFGAMLNPTGGLMGPDNGLPIQPGPNEPLGFHSVFHDAGGYLKNSHGIGPGYDYLGRESGYDAGNPFTGQVSGIDYWNDKIDTGFGTWAKTEAGEKIMWGVRTGDRAWTWTKDTASDAWSWTKDTASSGWDWIKGRF